MVPSKAEVIQYADNYLDYAIKKFASRYSLQAKEDIKQDGLVRVLKAYCRIEPDKGWMAFVQRHANGAVQDYIKKSKCKTRPDFHAEFSHDVEKIAYEIQENTELEINWELVARMASKDTRVLVLAKCLQGHTVSDISRYANFSRSGMVVMLNELYESMDDPFLLSDPWTNQIIFAFGLSEFFNMGSIDNGVGWDLKPIDIFNPKLKIKKLKRSEKDQMSLL